MFALFRLSWFKIRPKFKFVAVLCFPIYAIYAVFLLRFVPKSFENAVISIAIGNVKFSVSKQSFGL